MVADVCSYQSLVSTLSNLIQTLKFLIELQSFTVNQSPYSFLLSLNLNELLVELPLEELASKYLLYDRLLVNTIISFFLIQDSIVFKSLLCS